MVLPKAGSCHVPILKRPAIFFTDVRIYVNISKYHCLSYTYTKFICVHVAVYYLCLSCTHTSLLFLAVRFWQYFIACRIRKGISTPAVVREFFRKIWCTDGLISLVDSTRPSNKLTIHEVSRFESKPWNSSMLKKVRKPWIVNLFDSRVESTREIKPSVHHIFLKFSRSTAGVEMT